MLHAERLEKEGNEVFISASATFGACDLALDEARKLSVDKILHFGHNEFHKVDFDVEYVPYSIDAPLDILHDSLASLTSFKDIGVVTTVQHLHQLEAIRNFYEGNGKRVHIGRPYGFAKVRGQILGCDIGSAAAIDREVEVFVYFGGGLFHPIGALLSTSKPFLALDPFSRKMLFLDTYREQEKKRSRGRIAAALSASRFGILVSTKNGQHNMGLARLLKKSIEKEGMSAGILVSNSIDFDALNNMREFDAFVNTACPRIATDDNERLRRPLLSANELMEAIKLKSKK